MSYTGPNMWGSGWAWRPTRLAIYLRDDCCCIVCGFRPAFVDDLSLDHYLPRFKGGKNHAQNLLTMCGTCNSRKGAKTVREWFSFLRCRGFNVKKLSARIRSALRRSVDRAAGRELCDRIWPGWRARRNAKIRRARADRDADKREERGKARLRSRPKQKA